MDLTRLDHLLDLIVEHVDLAIQIHDQDRMTDPKVQVLDGDDAHLLVFPTQAAQRHELGDGVVLAIAELRHEFKWRGPVVLLSPVDRIRNVFRPIEIPVDLLDLFELRLVLDAQQELRPGLVMTFVHDRDGTIAFFLQRFFFCVTGKSPIPLRKGF